MPVHAYLQYDNIPCPYCDVSLQCGYEPEPCYITFGWGYCPSRLPGEIIYKVGEAIYWRPSKDGIVRGWTSFEGGRQFNAGDPYIEHLIVTDFGTDVAHFPQTCQSCRKPIGGAAIEIYRNIIKTAWAFPPGELLPGKPAHYHTVREGGELVSIPASQAQPWQITEYYLVESNGDLTPKPEWSYRLCDYFED